MTKTKSKIFGLRLSLNLVIQFLTEFWLKSYHEFGLNKVKPNKELNIKKVKLNSLLTNLMIQS